LVAAVYELQEANYEKGTPEVQQLYQCLQDAHASVEDIFKKNLSSLVYTNGLDLQVNNHMSKLTDMSSHVNDATEIILDVAKKDPVTKIMCRKAPAQLCR